MCKGEDNGGYTLHPTVLPEEYHGLTNKNARMRRTSVSCRSTSRR